VNAGVGVECVMECLERLETLVSAGVGAECVVECLERLETFSECWGRS